MAKRNARKQKILTQVDLIQAIASAGIWMMKFANEVEDTDISYGENFILDLINGLRLHSLMLHEAHNKLLEMNIDVDINLPDGIGAVETPNPFFRPDTTKPLTDDNGDVVEFGDDLPF